MLLVVGEYCGEAGVEFGGVHECVDLEVVLKAAEVEVGAPYGAYFVVDDYHFGVQHSGFVEVNFYAGFQTFVDV